MVDGVCEKNCDGTYKYTCTGMGYYGGVGEHCDGKYQSCQCQNDHKWQNGKCEWVPTTSSSSSSSSSSGGSSSSSSSGGVSSSSSSSGGGRTLIRREKNNCRDETTNYDNGDIIKCTICSCTWYWSDGDVTTSECRDCNWIVRN